MNKRIDYDAMTVEELEAELREAFFYSDRIDDTLSGDLERIREALERKRPTELRYKQAAAAVGRFSICSSATPTAIAPEETRITSWPMPWRSASTRAMCSIR